MFILIPLAIVGLTRILPPVARLFSVSVFTRLSVCFPYKVSTFSLPYVFLPKIRSIIFTFEQRKAITLNQTIILICLLCFLGGKTETFGQNQSDLAEGLNEYVRFTNESIHGMLIAHRLFENFNQDLNRYVDLPGQPLNFYGNSDLPSDIFEDPDQWFYEVSPQKLYLQLQENRFGLPETDLAPLLETAEEIRRATIQCNSLRLKLGESMQSTNLSVRDSLYVIYDQLERAVDAFDLLYARWTIHLGQLESLENRYVHPLGTPGKSDWTRLLMRLHRQSLDLLGIIRKKETEGLEPGLKALILSYDEWKNLSIPASLSGEKGRTARILRDKINSNLDGLIQGVHSYIQGPVIPPEYELYGAPYYYYNTQLINKINRYGNGLVPQINEWIDLFKLPMLHRFEIPHYLEIIYPKKVEKLVPLMVASRPEINETPLTLENRTVFTPDGKHVIYVDSSEPELEIFDHLQQDGDIISLYFNGDWIFENLSLERNPRKFKLRLNQSGKNFLILHAINEGSVPPNTIGINYEHKGRRKRYIMQSNLQTSQLVEIKLDK